MKKIFNLSILPVLSVPIIASISCSFRTETKKYNDKQEKKTSKKIGKQTLQSRAFNQLSDFVQKVKSKKLDLKSFDEKTASEIRYMNYLLKQKENNFEIFEQNNLIKLKIFWQNSKNIKKDQHDQIQGRIISTSHGDHEHKTFKSWKDLPPQDEKERQMYEQQKREYESQLNLPKGYTYAFKIKENGEINFKNVQIENDLFFSVLGKQSINLIEKKDNLFDFSFSPQTLAFDKDYRSEKGFYQIAFDDLVLSEYKVKKEIFLKQLKEHSKDDLKNYDQDDWKKLEFKDSIKKDLAEELLQSLIDQEKTLSGKTFLDKSYFDRGLKSILSYTENGFKSNWAIKESYKELLKDIVNLLVSSKSKIIGYDEVEVQSKLLDWYKLNFSSNQSFKKRMLLSPEEFKINYDAHIIMDAIGNKNNLVEKKILNLDQSSLQLLNNINKSETQYDQWVDSVSQYLGNIWKENVPSFLKMGKNIEDPVETLSKYWKMMKKSLPKSVCPSIKMKFYYFKDNNKKYYLKDFWDLAAFLSLYRRNNQPDIEGKLPTQIEPFQKEFLSQNALFTDVNKQITYKPKYGSEKTESLRDKFKIRSSTKSRINSNDLEIIFFPENIFEFKENTLYLSYKEKAFNSENDRKQFVDSQNYQDWF